MVSCSQEKREHEQGAAKFATCSAHVYGLEGGGMSTQEKLQGLGLSVPEAYASRGCSVCEGEGTADLLPHKPHMLLQLVLDHKARLSLLQAVLSNLKHEGTEW